MVVIDASALVDALLIDGTARSRLACESLQAPELIDAELLSVLRRLVLAGKLQEGDALQALTIAHQLGLRRHASRGLWLRAWECASISRPTTLSTWRSPSTWTCPCSPQMPAWRGPLGCAVASS
jgi:predicted nucleic acid-binding protein